MLAVFMIYLTKLDECQDWRFAAAKPIPGIGSAFAEYYQVLEHLCTS